MPIDYTPSPVAPTETISILAQTDNVIGGTAGASNVTHKTLADNIAYLDAKDFTDFKNSVETASGGRATVIADDNGNWNVMARIPKFKPSWLDSDLGSDGNYHPAFYVNGTLKDEIYIGLFQASDDGDGNLVSVPYADAVTDTFSNQQSSCSSLGTGWHMMTLHEYAALALLSLAETTALHGNTNFGRSHLAANEMGIFEDSSTDYIKSGSGPDNWRHDRQQFGVADLVGNHAEFVNLFKTVNSELYFPNDNYYTQAEGSWPAQGFYYSKDGSSNLIYANTASIDNVVYDRDWKDLEWPGTTTSIVNTSLLCDLMLWHSWASAVSTPVALLATVPGLRQVTLESATHHMQTGGDSGDTAATDMGLGYNFDVGASATGACRLAYIPA